MKELAVVTGATGVVGRAIVEELLRKGFSVRVLTRNLKFADSRVEVFFGELLDPVSVAALLNGAQLLFHCAAELRDEKTMWAVNSEATALLITQAEKVRELRYICHLSSVGVIGKFEGRVANESTECNPVNTYEKSKLAAENSVRQYKGHAQVIILRPTNVISKEKNGLSSLGFLKVFIKGGEHAHFVHACDVAAAACFFVENPSKRSPDCYIVSCDHEPMNTIAGSLAICNGKVRPPLHAPWQLAYFLRRLVKGPINRSDVIYASDKLLSAGFVYPLGLFGAIREICGITGKNVRF